MQSIDRNGANEEVERLWSKDSLWHRVLVGVSMGAEDRLKVADALLKCTDASSTQTLNLALGEALQKNPSTVIKRFGSTVAVICSGPDVDDPRFGTYEKAAGALAERARMVQSVEDHELKIPKEKCLQALENAKETTQKFFNAGQ